MNGDDAPCARCGASVPAGATACPECGCLVRPRSAARVTGAAAHPIAMVVAAIGGVVSGVIAGCGVAFAIALGLGRVSLESEFAGPPAAWWVLAIAYGVEVLFVGGALYAAYYFFRSGVGVLGLFFAALAIAAIWPFGACDRSMFPPLHS